MERDAAPLTRRSELGGIETLPPEAKEVFRRLHPRPAALHHDDELGAALLPLYEKPLPRIWSEHIVPFATARGPELEMIYTEHSESPLARVADS
ncbi:MAG TPA: hypothetical protein VEP28_05000, partial [Rubrobacter sp.]|nr:hypothetical protein [Rubrobacter sp.]